MCTEVIYNTQVLDKNFNVYGSFEEPLFLAKDVAEWIEHTDSAKMITSIDDDEKLLRTMFGAGQNRNVWMLTENGLYEVLMLSRKPIAKAFKKEVKKILHTLRTKGEVKLNNRLPDFTNPVEAARAWADEYEQKLTEKGKRIEAEKIIEEQEPLVNLGQAVVGSDDYVTVKELSSILSQNGFITGEKRLFEFLRNMGYLRRDNLPTQKSSDLGIMYVMKRTITDKFGNIRLTTKTMITTEGQKFFIHRLCFT